MTIVCSISATKKRILTFWWVSTAFVCDRFEPFDGECSFDWSLKWRTSWRAILVQKLDFWRRTASATVFVTTVCWHVSIGFDGFFFRRAFWKCTFDTKIGPFLRFWMTAIDLKPEATIGLFLLTTFNELRWVSTAFVEFWKRRKTGLFDAKIGPLTAIEFLMSWRRWRAIWVYPLIKRLTSDTILMSE